MQKDRDVALVRGDREIGDKVGGSKWDACKGLRRREKSIAQTVEEQGWRVRVQRFA